MILVYAESLAWRFENTMLASLLQWLVSWCAASLVWQYFKANRLGELVYAHSRRMSFSVVIALPLMAYGALLLHAEVDSYGMDPVQAFITNWPVITGLAFVSNRWLLWNDRRTPWLTAFWRWVAMSLGHTAISFSLYRVLVDTWGWHYLITSVALTPALALSSYILRNVWIFVADKSRMTAIP